MLLVLLAPPRGGSSSAGTDGPGRESRWDGSSRQTAREGKTTPRCDNLPVSSSVPAQHRAGSALELLIPSLPPGGMLRRGTRSGARMVLGWRLLWVMGDAAPSPDLQRWIQPELQPEEIAPESVGRCSKSHLAPCRGTCTQGARCGQRGNRLEMI